MRGRRRRDDGWDEGRRDEQDGPRDSWPGENGYQPDARTGRPAAGYTNGLSYAGQDGYTGYADPAGYGRQAPGGGAQGYDGRGYEPNGYGDAAQGFGGAGPESGAAGYQEPGYPGAGQAPAGYAGAGYSGTGYDPAGYPDRGYGASGYGSYGPGGSGPDAPGYPSPAGYPDAARGGRAGDPAYGGYPQPGYAAYGTGAADQVNGAAGRLSGEFPDPAATAQYGRPASPGGPEFLPADEAASGNENAAATPRPYGRLSIFTLLDDKAPEFDRLAERAAEGVRTAEPDTLVYVIHVVPKAPMQRIIYEIYRDRAAFESHEQQPHIQRFVADRRSCVLATNIIDLRLKYAKVAALGTSAAPLAAVLGSGAPSAAGPAGASGKYPANGQFSAAAGGRYAGDQYAAADRSAYRAGRYGGS
jgi:quinol monooxygenase YgiN